MSTTLAELGLDALSGLGQEDQVEITKTANGETSVARCALRSWLDPYASEGWSVVVRDEVGNLLGVVPGALVTEEPVETVDRPDAESPGSKPASVADGKAAATTTTNDDGATGQAPSARKE